MRPNTLCCTYPKKGDTPEEKVSSLPPHHSYPGEQRKNSDDCKDEKKRDLNEPTCG
jgi:hypothetical protein